MSEDMHNEENGSASPQTIGATASSGARILDHETAQVFAIQAAQSLNDDKC